MSGRLLEITRLLRAQHPVVLGVARATDSPEAYRLDCAPGATPQQIAAAQQMLDAFTPARPVSSEIKAEAERRILARYPIHKQLNALARSAELTLQGQGNWSPADAAEAAELLAMRAWIKSVRDVSNALEQSLPEDFAADARWPA